MVVLDKNILKHFSMYISVLNFEAWDPWFGLEILLSQVDSTLSGDACIEKRVNYLWLCPFKVCILAIAVNADE